LADAGYSNIEWRVLNSQFFGVAQRRRRVFIVASLGTEPFRTILSERESSAGDSEAGDQAGQETTGNAERSARTGSIVGSKIVGALCASDHKFPQQQQVHENKIVVNDGMWWDGGQVSQTLDTVIAKQQMMPEKNRFPVVLQERKS
jgi:site-specific DNA-cytosine methylase